MDSGGKRFEEKEALEGRIKGLWSSVVVLLILVGLLGGLLVYVTLRWQAAQKRLEFVMAVNNLVENNGRLERLDGKRVGGEPSIEGILSGSRLNEDLEKRLDEATVVFLAQNRIENGEVVQTVKEILKHEEGVECFYDVGEPFNTYPVRPNTRYGEGALVFCEGSPARMKRSSSIHRGRVGNRTIAEVREILLRTRKVKVGDPIEQSVPTVVDLELREADFIIFGEPVIENNALKFKVASYLKKNSAFSPPYEVGEMIAAPRNDLPQGAERIDGALLFFRGNSRFSHRLSISYNSRFSSYAGMQVADIRAKILELEKQPTQSD
ncbi:hypothetical protein [Roseibacillus persicicus]|uniref:hypothetical protein n=1 Tax=Roseibacillus persicicus TaxID=454148 RepID=UPI0028104EF0|nr:hypothetical protein [Roseibacillus persicicus]MDQ8189916.1 hypothetical protein [Roseibacillus persicicus]